MRRILTYAGLAVLAVLLLTVAAGTVLIATLDLNRYRDTVAEAVEKATGRTFALDGAIDFAPSLTPRITVHGVRLGNPDWAKAPHMLRVARAEIELDLMDLLVGRIDVRRLVLSAPEIILETDAEGRASWAFKPDEAAKPEPDDEGGAPPPVVFSSVRIEQGTVNFLDGVTGRLHRVDIGHLVALMDEQDSPIHAYGALRYNDEPVSITATLGNLPTVFANRPIPVDLALTAAGAALTITGSVAEPLKGRGLDLTIRTEGRALEELGRLAAAASGKPVPMPQLGPYAVRLRLAGAPEALALSDLQGRIGHPDAVLLELGGSVGALTKASGLDLTVSAQVKDLAPFAPLSREPLPKLAPVTLATRITGSAQQISLDQIDVAVGASKLAGLVTVDSTAKPLRIKAHLSSPFLDLVDLAPKDEAPAPKAPPAPAAPAAAADRGTAPVAAPPATRIFPDDPLPLDALRQASADIHLTADRIVARELDVGNAEVRAFLRRGVFHVTRARGRVGGGELDASFTVDARRGNRASLHTGVTIQGIELGSVLRDTGADDSVTGAPIDVRLSLTGAGGSLRELMGSLAGDVLLKVGAGHLENPYIDLIGADLLNETISFLNPFGSGERGAELNCAVVATVLRGGRALIDQTVAIETGKTHIVVGGEVNLGTETLDLAVRTESRSGYTVSAGMLSSLMRMGGTFKEPTVGMDTYGVARTAASIAAAWATGGVSLLAEAVVGAVTRDASPCRTALVRAKTAMTEAH